MLRFCAPRQRALANTVQASALARTPHLRVSDTSVRKLAESWSEVSNRIGKDLVKVGRCCRHHARKEHCLSNNAPAICGGGVSRCTYVTRRDHGAKHASYDLDMFKKKKIGAHIDWADLVQRIYQSVDCEDVVTLSGVISMFVGSGKRSQRAEACSVTWCSVNNKGADVPWVA